MRNNLPGGCCACVASGQTAADPAITLMKSRRRMAFPRLGLCRLGRDYSRVLRSTERGSGVKLQGNNRELSMSALGQKRTFLEFCAMSALPPKADMVQHDCDVRCQKRTLCTAQSIAIYRGMHC